MVDCNIFVENFSFNISKKNNTIQMSIFNNDKICQSKIRYLKYDEKNNCTVCEANYSKENKDEKILFFRQKIDKTNSELLKFARGNKINSEYYLKNVFYEFDKNTSSSIECGIDHFESNFISLQYLKKTINNLKNDIDCSYCFFEIYGDCGSSDGTYFSFDNEKKKYTFTIEMSLMDDLSQYSSIVIDYNQNNKYKIIKLFKKIYELIKSI